MKGLNEDIEEEAEIEGFVSETKCQGFGSKHYNCKGHLLVDESVPNEPLSDLPHSHRGDCRK